MNKNEFLNALEKNTTDKLDNLYKFILKSVNIEDTIDINYFYNDDDPYCERIFFGARFIISDFNKEAVKEFPYDCEIYHESYKINMELVHRKNQSNYIIIEFFRNNSIYYSSTSDELTYYNNKNKNSNQTIIIYDDLTMYRVFKEKFIPVDLKYLSNIRNSGDNKSTRFIGCILKYFSTIHPLFKDIYYEFNEYPIYLPITINEIWECFTKRDLIKRHCKSLNVPSSINKCSLHLGYLLVKCQRYVDPKEYQKLFVIKDSFNPMIMNVRVNEQIKQCFFLYYYETINEKLKYSPGSRFSTILEDYIYMFWDYQKPRKFNLRISSFKRIIDEHDKISQKLYMKSTPTIKIPKNSKFKELKLPLQYEKIRTRKRIIEETVMQNNCVWSYADKINKDVCSIYSTLYNGNRYTIEIRKKKNKYILNQVFGIGNTDPPEELVDEIKRLIA